MRPLNFAAAALCLLPGCLLPSGGATDTNADESESTAGESTSTPTTGPVDPSTTTTADDTSTTADPTTTAGDVCGDGAKSGDEECDNGGDNADDAACLSTCKLNICGDGFVDAAAEACDDGNSDDDDDCVACAMPACGDGHVQAGVEACDDAKNDGSYDGCSADCSVLGPHCGDGAIDAEHEECDEAENPACLSSCEVAKSCLLLHDADATIVSGVQTLYPAGLDNPIDVYCDMDSDGGGYTFLKLDVDSDLNDLPYPAKKAETECAKYGMHLWIPRSPAHLAAGYAIATGENLPPLGGGTKLAGADYMGILGIYPETENVSCTGLPLTSDDCPEWIASDEQDWYVSDVSKNALEPDADAACANCSMAYTWNVDGTVKSYKTVPNGGSSFRFFCDTGDKLP